MYVFRFIVGNIGMFLIQGHDQYEVTVQNLPIKAICATQLQLKTTHMSIILIPS